MRAAISIAVFIAGLALLPAAPEYDCHAIFRRDECIKTPNCEWPNLERHWCRHGCKQPVAYSFPLDPSREDNCRPVSWCHYSERLRCYNNGKIGLPRHSPVPLELAKFQECNLLMNAAGQILDRLSCNAPGWFDWLRPALFR
jgi:hypothetical protein